MYYSRQSQEKGVNSWKLCIFYCNALIAPCHPYSPNVNWHSLQLYQLYWFLAKMLSWPFPVFLNANFPYCIWVNAVQWFLVFLNTVSHLQHSITYTLPTYTFIHQILCLIFNWFSIDYILITALSVCSMRSCLHWERGWGKSRMDLGSKVFVTPKMCAIFTWCAVYFIFVPTMFLQICKFKHAYH